VGYRQWLFSTSRGARYIYSQGEVWMTIGGVTTYATLPTGFALGTDGVQIVGGNAGATGSSGASAMLWTAPSPSGPWTSIAMGPGYATSCLNGRQFGQSNGHAAVWSGGYGSTDLNPSGASSSKS